MLKPGRHRRRRVVAVASPFVDPNDPENDPSSDNYSVASSSWYSRCKEVNFPKKKNLCYAAATGKPTDLTISTQTSKVEETSCYQTRGLLSPTRRRLLQTARGLSAYAGSSRANSRTKMTSRNSSKRMVNTASSQRLMRVVSRFMHVDAFNVKKRFEAKYFGKRGREEFFSFFRALAAERNHYTREQQKDWVKYVFPNEEQRDEDDETMLLRHAESMSTEGGDDDDDDDDDDGDGDDKLNESIRIIHRVSSLGSLGEGGGLHSPSNQSTRGPRSGAGSGHGHASAATRRQQPPMSPQSAQGEERRSVSFFGAPASLDLESLTHGTMASDDYASTAMAAAAEVYSDDVSAVTMDIKQQHRLPPVKHDDDGLGGLYAELFGATSLGAAAASSSQDTARQQEAAAGGVEPVISTPRGWYALGCIETESLPAPSNIIRKSAVKTLSLAHKGIGDLKMLTLVKSLRRLPNVQTLDLCDNRLTDVSLQEVMRSVEHMRDLTSLNLGYNELNQQAARMLRRYLAGPSASVTELNLASADVDDMECASFMRAIQNNSKLTSLNLSHNLIGAMETHNILHPEFITGGEAIAEQLEKPTCQLRVLDLSWNGLRQSSATALGRALQANNSLVELDVQYNALGQEGGLSIASALFHNRTLRRLIMRSNSLTPLAAYCLAISARYNGRLEYLDVSGNNLGVEGGRHFMGLALDLAGQLELVFEECSFEGSDAALWFDTEAPGGTHRLDLDQIYDRCVLVEMLHMVAHREGITFKSFSHEAVGGAVRDHQLRRQSCPIEPLDRGPFTEQELRDEFRDNLHARQGSRLQAHQLQTALDNLGLDLFPLEDCQNFIHFYDRGFSGGLTFEEFGMLADYLYQMCEDLLPCERFVVDGNSTLGYDMPLSGVVTTTIEFRPRLPLEGGCTSIAQVEAFMQVAMTMGDLVKAMELAAPLLRLELDEASLLYELLSEEGAGKSEAMALVLQRVFNPTTAHLLLDRHFTGFSMEKRRLVFGLGPLYYPIFGVPSRRYRLDLNRRLDRLALERLYLMQNRDNVLRVRRRPLKPDTSFRADGSNFRNATLKGRAVVLDHDFFERVPTSGLLQFDYMVHLRPETHRRYMSDQRFLQYLANIRLLAPWEITAAQQQLNDENRPRELHDSYQHNLQAGARLGVQLSRLYGDPFPNQDDERMKRMAALNAIYEEGVKRLSWGNTARVGGGKKKRAATRGKNDLLDPQSGRRTSMPDASKALAGLRRWAQRARVRVHWQEILHEISTLLCNRLLTVNQAVLLLASYPEELLDEMEAANSGPLQHDPAPGRLRLAVALYPCLLDLFDIDKLLFLFSPEQQAEYVFRVGRLNVLNVLKPDGAMQFCLERREERQACKIYMQLTLDEPGENMTQETWRYSRLEPCFPGWQVTENWKSESGFGSRGFITFSYYSGEGKGYHGCAPHYALRAALSLLTNVDVPEGLLRLLVPATQHMNRQQMDEYLLDYIRQNMARNGIRFEHHVDPPPL